MVYFEKLVEQLWDKTEEFESQVIYDSTVICGNVSSREYMNKSIEETEIEVPGIFLDIFEKYGGYTLRWLKPHPSQSNRLLYAYNYIWATRYFDYGGFQNRITYKNNTDVGIPFYPEDASQEELNFWRQLYILGDLEFGKLVLLKPDPSPGGENHELYLFDHPKTIAKLTVNLEQYFELVEKTMGLYCWQEYVTEENYKLDGSIPDRFHENMSVLFPNENLSLFRPAPALEDSVFNRFVSSSDKTDYRALFIAKMDELRENPKIEFKYYEDTVGYKRETTPYTANYGVPEAVLRKVKHDYGREISARMLAFYYQMNGCKVQWVYDNSEEGNDFWLEGKINFLELEEVMGGNWKESYLEWNSPDLFKDEGAVYHFTDEEATENPEMAELMKTARLFDEQGEMQDYFIQFVEGKEEPTIYKITVLVFTK